MLNRRVTRVVLGSTEITDLVKIDSAAYSFALTTSSELYIGYHGPFAGRYIQIGTANSTASVMSVTYWDGSAWTAVDDLLDQTSVGGKTLATSGFVSWVNKGNWVKKAITGIDSDVELYWVKITVSANLHASTTVKSFLNIYNDDNILKAYYPEIISDSAYLPPNETNFLKQYIAAKDLIVLKLKQRRLIDDESQIIDINDVAIAAAHASAWIILRPIARSEETRLAADDAEKAMNKELQELVLGTDQSKDGIVSSSERLSSFGNTEVNRR